MLKNKILIFICTMLLTYNFCSYEYNQQNDTGHALQIQSNIVSLETQELESPNLTLATQGEIIPRGSNRDRKRQFYIANRNSFKVHESNLTYKGTIEARISYKYKMAKTTIMSNVLNQRKVIHAVANDTNVQKFFTKFLQENNNDETKQLKNINIIFEKPPEILMLNKEEIASICNNISQISLYDQNKEQISIICNNMADISSCDENNEEDYRYQYEILMAYDFVDHKFYIDFD